MQIEMTEAKTLRATEKGRTPYNVSINGVHVGVLYLINNEHAIIARRFKALGIDGGEEENES